MDIYSASNAKSITLRDYQTDLIGRIEASVASGVRRIIIVAPTGSGKTIIGSEIVNRAVAAYKTVLFVAHRNELLSQAKDKLSKFGIAASVIKAGRDREYRPMATVQVAGIRCRTVAFAVDVKHSVHIVDQMQRSGIKAEHLDANTPQHDRIATLERLATGETEVISNVGILTEGFDLPDIGCIALVRPTRSLGLFRQMIGRGLRPAEGKTDVIVLDHAGGVHRHGRPDDPVEWTLETDRKAINRVQEARIAKAGKDPFCECNACGHLRMRGMACDNCGWSPRVYGRDVDIADGELVELGKSPGVTINDKIIFYTELRGFQKTARRRDGTPYSTGWAAHKFKEKYHQWLPREWNAQPVCEPSSATARWIKSRQIAWAKRQAS